MYQEITCCQCIIAEQYNNNKLGYFFIRINGIFCLLSRISPNNSLQSANLTINLRSIIVTKQGKERSEWTEDTPRGNK